LKLQYDEPLSNFAFNFYLRRYITEPGSVALPRAAGAAGAALIMAGRCRLTVSKPVLKARLVSALETKM